MGQKLCGDTLAWRGGDMRHSKIESGDIFETSGGRVVVLEYQNAFRVLIKNLDQHKHRSVVRASHLRNGSVGNPFKQSVFGVGFTGIGKYRARVGGVITPEYQSWVDMLKRCYDFKSLEVGPTYANVEVCDEWHNLQNFAQWWGKQNNSGTKGYHLDKDLVKVGNRIYGPNVCSFVPQEVNSLLTDHRNARGDFPQGVSMGNEGFIARLSTHGYRVYLGTYSTPQEAYHIYKTAKESHVKLIAEKYKDHLDVRVYNYLKTWELETDLT